EFIERYAAQKGLGTVDASMPPGSADHLRALMRLTILSNAAASPVKAQMPDHLRQLLASRERIQSQLTIQYGLRSRPPKPNR
ncbi:MAG: hypothetical protein ABMA01_09775, partial [Chthoniobacteraceae bacterium]